MSAQILPLLVHRCHVLLLLGGFSAAAERNELPGLANEVGPLEGVQETFLPVRRTEKGNENPAIRPLNSLGTG